MTPEKRSIVRLIVTNVVCCVGIIVILTQVYLEQASRHSPSARTTLVISSWLIFTMVSSLIREVRKRSASK